MAVNRKSSRRRNSGEDRRGGGGSRGKSRRGGKSGGRGKGRGDFPEPIWVNIASIWDKNGKLSMSFDDYFGDIYFVPKVTRKNKEKMGEFKDQMYKVNFASVMEPNEAYDPPENLAFKISLNLANDTAVELVDEEGGGGSEEESDYD